MYFSVLIIKKDVSFHKRSLAVFKAFSWCLYRKRNLSEGEVAALDLYTQRFGGLWSNPEWQFCRQRELVRSEAFTYTSLAGLCFKVHCSTSHDHQMEEETQMTSPGILLCAVCCSYLIPESSSASPQHRCALKNKSFTAKLAALRTSEWNTEPELYSLHKFVFVLFCFCWRNNPYMHSWWAT